MWRIKTYEDVYDYAIGLCAVILLLAPKLIVVGLLPLFLLMLVGIRKQKVAFRIDGLALLMVCMYLLYLIYGLFTRHPSEAFGYFEKKLSFIAFPIILSFRLRETIAFKRATYIFLLALFILLSESIVHSISCYHNGGGMACFLASIFSYQHHPTYTSVFLFVGIALFFYARKNFKLSAWIIIPAIGILLIATLLCLSLSGLLLILASAGVVAMYLVYNYFGKKWMFLSVAVLPVLLYASILSIPKLEGEWTNATWYANEYLKNPQGYFKGKDYPFSGTEVRLAMWTASTEVFMQYPLGVGTGNVDEVLGSKLRSMHLPNLAKQNYNPHNQYLQTGVEIGIVGLLLLIGMVLYLIRKGWRQRNWLILAITANFAINMLFESMLQRQSGIVFYAFILLLLSLYSDSKTETVS